MRQKGAHANAALVAFPSTSISGSLSDWKMLCYCKCGKQRANFLIVGEAFGFVRDFVVLSGAKRLSCWSRTIVRELRRRGCKSHKKRTRRNRTMSLATHGKWMTMGFGKIRQQLGGLAAKATDFPSQAFHVPFTSRVGRGE